MKLYNTLSKSVEEIKPLKDSLVTVYTCGPTVYDFSHIGHWFNYIRMDTLIRVLKINGYSVKWIMNITDVGHLVSDADDGEDKLEKGAKRENKSAWDIAEFYTKDFLNCMKILNITKPDFMPRATEHIPEQINLIKILEEKGYTYSIDDGVYFDTSKFPKYADFANLDISNIKEGARVSFNPQKKNPTDFALWKLSPINSTRDMEWDSPWGKGFPGWHIECSAMSMKYLGETIDIHTGGIDHIPVHHTNEIAQSQSATGKVFANYWMHSNHLMINGQKISKSLQNGIRIQEIISKSMPVDAFRLLVMESHYRSHSNYNNDGLTAAKNRLQTLMTFADLRFQKFDSEKSQNYPDLISDLKKVRADFIDAINNDLQTPKALSILSDIQSKITNKLTAKEIDELIKFIEVIDKVFGLNLLKSHDINEDQKNLIKSRELARKEKDYQSSDKIRETLQSMDIDVNDTDSGTIWSRIF